MQYGVHDWPAVYSSREASELAQDSVGRRDASRNLLSSGQAGAVTRGRGANRAPMDGDPN